jgi:hypothetical protein
MYLRTLDWIKCQGNQWCNLFTVNLDHPHFDRLEGVYVIWHAGERPWTVYAGQGVIKDRLAAHRQDPAIRQYAPLGLFVTWAKVDAFFRDGVERFLADRLAPKEGVAHPQASGIAVNLPW